MHYSLKSIHFAAERGARRSRRSSGRAANADADCGADADSGDGAAAAAVHVEESHPVARHRAQVPVFGAAAAAAAAAARPHVSRVGSSAPNGGLDECDRLSKHKRRQSRRLWGARAHYELEYGGGGARSRSRRRCPDANGCGGALAYADADVGVSGEDGCGEPVAHPAFGDRVARAQPGA